MKIVIGNKSGFCFGVKRAVDTALENAKDNICILGEIIHNDKVNLDLKNKGITTITDISESNGRTTLIRAHGEPKSTFDRAKELGVKIIDCTCPFVSQIHKIVDKFYKLGYQIVIVGKADHPEVIGINGWCEGSAVITDDFEEISKISAKNICVVAQTTYSTKKFDELRKKIETLTDKKLEIFKTICYTTRDRQIETELLAKSCDAIIVIGGANSSNTEKLYSIAKQYNNNVFRVTDPDLFDRQKIKNFIKVGIVLGASTPIEQAQEVIQGMEVTEVNTTETEIKVEDKVAPKVEKYTMDEEMKRLAKKPATFKVGQILTVKISSANEEGLAVYIPNTKKEIMLSKDEMIVVYNKEDYADKVDSEIRVMVTKLNPVVLSEKAMVKIIKEEAEVKEIADGKIFEATVTEVNKGGLIAKFGSYTVFVPSSQIRIGFVKDLDKYVGKTLRLKAEKVEMGRRKQIVASQRVILEAEKAERDAIKAEKLSAFFNSIQEGDVVIGTPVRFAEFGAFVQVNGFDCLARISDLSWTGCKNPADVLELNKEYQFQILKIDADKQRVSIGYKQLQPKPWALVDEKYNVGDVITGKVVRIVSFGAFVEVEKGIDGLVHVSQISNKWLENPLTALTIGEEVQAKIMAIDSEKEKMTLSIKVLLPEEPKKETKVVVKEEPEEEPELKEWIDDDNASISIAEMIGKIED